MDIMLTMLRNACVEAAIMVVATAASRDETTSWSATSGGYIAINRHQVIHDCNNYII